MDRLQELREELRVKNAKLAKVFEEAGADNDMSKVNSLGDGVTTSREKTKKIEEMNLELNDLGIEIDSLVKTKKIEQETKKRGLPRAGGGVSTSLDICLRQIWASPRRWGCFYRILWKYYTFAVNLYLFIQVHLHHLW